MFAVLSRREGKRLGDRFPGLLILTPAFTGPATHTQNFAHFALCNHCILLILDIVLLVFVSSHTQVTIYI